MPLPTTRQPLSPRSLPSRRPSQKLQARLSEALAQVDVLAAEKQASEAAKSEALHEAQLSLEKALEEIATLKTLISEMESERKELSRKLDAATDDKAAVESQVAALNTSKSEVEARLSEALAQVDVLAAEKQASKAANSEEMHEAQLSLEKSLEEITTLKTLISEMESERKELSRKLDAATRQGSR